MTEFRKYPHLERIGTPEVDGIEVGRCLVFPKLDGTNASVWAEIHDAGVCTYPVLHSGSRRRSLSLGDADNFGFAQWVSAQQLHGEPLWRFFATGDFAGERYRLFGEWLVPHTFKDYRGDAWRRFWIFDVYDEVGQYFLPYHEYQPMLDSVGLDYVPPLCSVTNPTEEQLRKIAEGNTFLCKEGAGPGEGIVIKRYDFVSRYGHTVWAKLVRGEFKDEALTAMGAPEKGEKFQVEVAIAQTAVTPELVSKERSKISQALIGDYIVAGNDWDGYPGATSDFEHQNKRKLIPRLLETVFHCVCTEELWPLLKRFKDPAVDFKKLRKHVIAQTKRFASDLF